MHVVRGFLASLFGVPTFHFLWATTNSTAKFSQLSARISARASDYSSSSFGFTLGQLKESSPLATPPPTTCQTTTWPGWTCMHMEVGNEISVTISSSGSKLPFEIFSYYSEAYLKWYRERAITKLRFHGEHTDMKDYEENPVDRRSEGNEKTM